MSVFAYINSKFSKSFTLIVYYSVFHTILNFKFLRIFYICFATLFTQSNLIAGQISTDHNNILDIYSATIPTNINIIKGKVVDHKGLPTQGDIAYLVNSDGAVVAQDSIRNQEFELIYDDGIVSVNITPTEQVPVLSAENLWPNQGKQFNFEFSLPSHSSKAYILTTLGKTIPLETDGPGTYRGTWNGQNQRGETVSSGMYSLVVTDGDDEVIAKKGILLEPSGASTLIGRAGEPEMSAQKVTLRNHKVMISGEDAITTYSDDIDLDTGDDFDIGEISVPRKPVAEMFLYDLDSKYPESNNYELTTPNGVADLIVFDGNNLDNWARSDANGMVSLKFDEKTFTTLYVAGSSPSDSTYYFFKLEADINQYGKQTVNAFRDPTGIPIIPRETIGGWDIVDWMNWISEIRLIEEEYQGKIIHTTTRISDDLLPIKVFLDRDNVPEAYMADQALRAMDSLSHARTQYIETLDSTEATGRMRYHATSVLGFTQIYGEINNAEGRVITGFDVLMNTSSNYINQEHFSIVIGHELGTHAEKLNGVGTDPNSDLGYYHSPDINDISFSPTTTRYNQGITHFRSEKEKRENEILYKLPNGFLSLDIIKSDPIITEFFNQ
jgi:hypothetical protein